MVRVDNDPVALAAAVTEAGPYPKVVIEATYKPSPVRPRVCRSTARPG